MTSWLYWDYHIYHPLSKLLLRMLYCQQLKFFVATLTMERGEPHLYGLLSKVE
jgi:hypothetical protein